MILPGLGSFCAHCQRFVPDDGSVCTCGRTPPHRWIENLANYFRGEGGHAGQVRPGRRKSHLWASDDYGKAQANAAKERQRRKKALAVKNGNG